MRKYKGALMAGTLLVVAVVLSGCLSFHKSEPVDELAWLKRVEWVFEDDFSEYEVGAFPSPNWVSFHSGRTETWSVVEFEKSKSGYALKGDKKGHDPNRLILVQDVKQVRTGKIVLQARLWLDNKGLQGVDLWDSEHTWENYASLHPWNSGWRDAFKDEQELRPYDMVVLFDLTSRTMDIYVDGSLLKADVKFRDTHEIPEEETYRVGLTFNDQGDSTPVYWERVRVGRLN